MSAQPSANNGGVHKLEVVHPDQVTSSVGGNGKDKKSAIKLKGSWFLSDWLFLFVYSIGHKARHVASFKSIYYSLSSKEQARLNADDMEKAWNHQVSVWKSSDPKTRGEHPSVLKALVEVYGGYYALIGIWKLLWAAFTWLGAYYFLKQTIAFVASNQDISVGHYWAIAVLISALLSSIAIHQLYAECNRVAIRVQAALSSLIYRKSLRLSRIPGGSGEVINLLNTDLQRVVDGVCNFHFLWSAFLETAAIIAITFYEIGVSAVPALIMILLLLPIQMYLGSKQFNLNKQQTRITTERVHIMSEILTAIKLIKFYAWEKPFTKKISELREQEMSLIYQGMIARTINFCVVFSVPVLAALCSLGMYVGLGNKLTAAVSFAVLSVLNTLRYPFFMLPMAVRGTVGTINATNKMGQFLVLDEVEGLKITKQEKSDNDDNLAFKIDNSDFKWDGSDGDKPTLKNINLKAKKGQKVAIIGDVGSGKSSLISALLGEIRQVGGQKLEVYGTTSYASQEPWLLNDTLRSNVLFGMQYDKKKYKETIRVCALQRDLTLLIAGDLTEIAERGANLSGGQRQRVNLARAIHHDCEIILLDDPLSAVDQHVGSHIFNECFMKHCKSKTMVVSLHQLQYLKDFDWVVMMKDGEIETQGSYESLMSESSEFKRLIQSHVAEASAEGVDDEAEVLNQDDFEIPDEDKPSKAQSSLKPGAPKSLEVLVDKSRGKDKANSQLSLQDIHQLSVRKNVELNDETVSNLIEKHQRSVLRGGANFHHDVNRTIQANELSIFTMTQGDFDEEALALERGKLVKEDVSANKAGFGDFVTYAKSAWGQFTFYNIAIFFFLVHGVRIASDYWLRLWVPRVGGFSDAVYIGVYGASCVLFSVGVFLRGYFFSKQTRAKSIALHKALFHSVMRASMSFFDSTPLGRILSAFSKHLLLVDDIVPDAMLQALQYIPLGLGALILPAAIVPFVWAPAIGLCIIASLVVYYSAPAENATKSLEAITKPPIYAHLTSTLEGLFSIRAYHAQKRFDDMNIAKLDDNHEGQLATNVVKSWIALNLDLLSSLFVYFTALCCVLFRNTPEMPSTTGLALSNALQMLVFLQWSVRMIGEVIGKMSSVGQIDYYGNNVAPEAPANIPDKKPADEWPQQGLIKFENIGLKYSEFGVKVLKNISFNIYPTEKIGIVGRTGSGKSTLLISLLRIVEACEGKITIDGVDISELGLEDLRTKIAIIPQEPVLFKGTVRSNLDPFNHATDEEIWKALESVHLSANISQLPEKLETIVIENGKNFSLGQRQLFCIARAILAKTKVLVLDEATANVSPETDLLIQTAIRENFKDVTVLTIAHRLNTIIDSDRVLVLDQGKILELDDPVTLLEKKNGSFKDLVDQTGPATAKRLYDLALEGQKQRNSKVAEEDKEPKAGATTIQELAGMPQQ
ncbi:hypothetical protein MP228_003039 [Amoeboaphelidium protococcarum]|nr:hypothetical protein MP228_003039 [Amoeboaphelidium protococcarum]